MGSADETRHSFPIGVHRPGSPWGFWGTTAFGLVIAAVYLLTAVLPGGFILAMRYPHLSVEQAGIFFESLVFDGSYITIALLTTAIVCGGLIFLFVLAKRGIAVADYLALHLPAKAAFFKWLAIVILWAAACDATSALLKRDVVPEFMAKAYATAGNLPLLWLGLVVAAPVFEELFFRGFLFAGWSRSFLGPKGTILLTSILWASMHQQYRLYEIATIGVLGIILGLARLKTQSLYTPMLLHSLVNIVATIEVVLLTKNPVG